MTETFEEPELDGMPDAPEPALIVRVNGDQVFEDTDLDGLEANDQVTLTGVRGVVKKVGVEAYQKTGVRPFVQIHITDFANVRVR